MNTSSKLINTLLEEASSRVNISKERLLINAGISPKQYRDYLKANRPFSDSMLIGLGGLPELGLTYEQLLAWKALDMFPVEVLKIAVSMEEERRKALGDTNEQA